MAVRLAHTDPDFAARFAALVTGNRAVGRRRRRARQDDRRGRARHAATTALLEYTATFDRLRLTAADLRVSAAEIADADGAITPDQRAALKLAHDRIAAHHRRQMPSDDSYRDELGVELGTRWTAIEAVGLYVPGGTAAYPSSVLMNAVPAKVAGVERIVMVTPTPDGMLNPLVLAAARLGGRR